ncbi:MAG: hypothetical protein KDA87_18125 [Planctomycetales bacterium]|nr:hypothetical protein [Planctomycetales bacterium]
MSQAIPSSSQISRRRQPQWARRILMVGVFIAIITVLRMWIPHEIAMWHLAKAGSILKQLDEPIDDDESSETKRHQIFSQAFEELDKAASWAGKDPAVFLARAQARMREIRYLPPDDLQAAWRSVEYDLSEAIKLRPAVPDFYRLRANANYALGKAEDAIRDSSMFIQTLTDIPNYPSFMYAVALNQRAYMRALTGREISEGLDDIQKAFQISGKEKEEGSFLDTRGYLRFKNGQLDDALIDVTRALKLIQSESIDEEGEAIAAREEAIGVVYYHRFEILSALGKEDSAQFDYDEAMKRDYDPERGIF